MSEGTKAGLIIGAAIIIAMGLYLYFSPLQQCMRAQAEYGREGSLAKLNCLAMLKG